MLVRHFCRARLAIIGLAFLFAECAAFAQGTRNYRVIVDTGVACRSKPDRRAPVGRKLPLAQTVSEVTSIRVSRVVWYRDSLAETGRGPECWVDLTPTRT
jgi:hypothetical protein